VPATYTGAVVRSAGAPLTFEPVRMPTLGPTDVLLKVTACGLCHSDVHFMRGTSGQDFPYLVGHEVAGTVARTGADVDNVREGDSVVVAPMVPCGRCKHCLAGRTPACPAKLPRNPAVTLSDGVAAQRVLGVGGLAEFAVMPARQVVAIDPRVPPKIAALLGCGVPSGFGAAVNTAAVGPQDDVVVIGLGGVGLAAVAGARHAHASRIIAVDTNPAKLPVAVRFGATHTIDASTEDVADSVRAVTGGSGADVVIDAVGGPRTFALGLGMRAPGGRLIVVGAPKTSDTAELPMRDFFLRGGRLEVSIWGDCVASRDLPMLAARYLDGSLPLDEYVDETYPLNAAQRGYERLVAGQAVRPVVLL
jgi:S-(hydroxymethyl)mycothiol dehydrogenase